MFSRNYVPISLIFNKLPNPVNPGIARDYCFFNPGSRDSQNRPGLSSQSIMENILTTSEIWISLLKYGVVH